MPPPERVIGSTIRTFNPQSQHIQLNHCGVFSTCGGDTFGLPPSNAINPQFTQSKQPSLFNVFKDRYDSF